ncbi:hypothetical protein CAPTEDRAFT_210665 [Capitella teleta]|uniref:Uncharacterized protein n=1 Tax=Capitella teleta TaxID=283909 RepID=R7UZK7_CAPTE|nr:hypothetical protein CAPTEDRAFT_210665 [Capitella teleta]|eukprot:ELU12023.1 hypothetical protein CAPTEDRAFT_210665 [Capitella teleta]
MKIIVLVCVAIVLCSVADAKKNNGKGSSKVETTDPPCFTQEDCAEVINCEWGYHRASHNAYCYACECRDEPCARLWCPEWSKCVNDRLFCRNKQCDYVGNCISGKKKTLPLVLSCASDLFLFADVSGLVVKTYSY